ncbi:hypothetical protein L7F22_034553 [Adiantum nelumboides]|nr:hypothetical protein [Adiantum nelumboides]
MQFCSLGLDKEPDNMELLKLRAVIKNKLRKTAAFEEQMASEVTKAEVLSAVIADRGVSVDTTAPPWDVCQNYTREKVQLFYKAKVGPKLSKMQMLCYLLEGKNIPDYIRNSDDKNNNNSETDNSSHQWVQVSEKSSLHNVLAKKDHVIPGIPVFYVLSKGSEFFKEFFSGRS